MYGKKRIVLTQRHEIVIAGNKSWCPVGIWKYGPDGGFVAQIVKPKYIYTCRKTDKMATTIETKTKKEIKSAVVNIHNVTL